MNPAKQGELIASLVRLGFTELEALVYSDLLRHPRATGYGIGKSIRKPHANVYQALTALEQMGAVVFEEGTSRIYSAVAPSELLGQLRMQFETECENAGKALERLGAGETEEGGYFRLTSRVQVFERARIMLQGAAETIVFHGGPAIASDLREDLERTVERGVALSGLTMREADLIPGSKMVLSRVADRLAQSKIRFSMILVVDAREFLVAQFDDAESDPLDAVWSRGGFFIQIFHNAIVSDTILHGLPEMTEIRSPNRYLLGRLPSAMAAAARTRD